MRRVTVPATPLVLAGGAGRRLWPLSRSIEPKPFAAVSDGRTLLQATARRIAGVAQAGSPIVVCNEAHRFLVAEQMRAGGAVPMAVVLEPCGRGTAPAIAAGALEALARTDGAEDPILAVLPVDHAIRDVSRFADALAQALTEAAQGSLVTFGVAPAGPQAGYGWIRAGRPTGPGEGARRVERFVEKPHADEAAGYVADGRWWWNSGMFVFGARRYLEELRVHEKAVFDAVAEAHRSAVTDLGFLRLDRAAFASAPGISVDHAVMERTAAAVMVPLDAGWSDIGSWTALAELDAGDDAGNVASGDVLFRGARNTYVRGGERLIAAVGTSNLVIADTPDALLVLEKGAEQEVAQVVAALDAASRPEARRHRAVHRPWGSCDVVHAGDGFRIRRLVVQSGKGLSLQSHRQRAEHWVVVRGVARVTRGEESFLLAVNQSAVIPAGVRHRLENPGAKALEIVEVQTGGQLGEDGIVRHDGPCGRTERDDRPDVG